VLGAPLDPDAVAASGIVGPAGVAALTAGLRADLPPLEGDASVGAVLRPRLGDEVVDRMVDPLLGGINAGEADRLSIRSGAAALAAAAARGGPFVEALRAHVAAARPGPVFHAVEGGSRLIVQALVDELGDRIRTEEPVTALTRTTGGWEVATAKGSHAASRVVLTSPAWVTAELLAPHAPDAATMFAELDYADAVLVTFVARRDQVAHELDGAGFLVPRDQGLLMTATSISSSKWSHYDDGDHVVLRVSAGRTDDTRWTQRPLDQVVSTLRDELERTVGLTGPTIHRVSEWRRCLPQYRPGHLDRCDRIDDVLADDAPGIAVAGASMRGLGLPACVRQGREAVRGV
jgi:oxygen-dependent protoporphyrinogen oxidase